MDCIQVECENNNNNNKYQNNKLSGDQCFPYICLIFTLFYCRQNVFVWVNERYWTSGKERDRELYFLALSYRRNKIEWLAREKKKNVNDDDDKWLYTFNNMKWAAEYCWNVFNILKNTYKPYIYWERERNTYRTKRLQSER